MMGFFFLDLKQWVEEQRQKIATLTDDKAYLKRVAALLSVIFFSF